MSSAADAPVIRILTLFPDMVRTVLETSIPGIFAAGDVRDKSTKQVVSAAGEGGSAALMIREYLKGM